MWTSKVLRLPVSCRLTRVFEMKSPEIAILDRQFDFHWSNLPALSSLSRAAIFFLPRHFPLTWRPDGSGAHRDEGQGPAPRCSPGWGAERAAGGQPQQGSGWLRRPHGPTQKQVRHSQACLWAAQAAWPATWAFLRPLGFFRPLQTTHGAYGNSASSPVPLGPPTPLGKLAATTPLPPPRRMEGRLNVPFCVWAVKWQHWPLAFFCSSCHWGPASSPSRHDCSQGGLCDCPCGREWVSSASAPCWSPRPYPWYKPELSLV